MASPQKEHGYTPIAHEIIEALIKQHLSGRQWEVVMLILRESYGQSRKEALLSYGDISRRIGCARSHSARVIRSLVLPKMVTEAHVTKGGNTHKNVYRFQKDYLQWGVTQIGNSTKDGNVGVTKVGNEALRGVSKQRKAVTPANPEVRHLIDLYYQHQKNLLGSPPMSFPGAMAGRFFKSLLGRGMTSEQIQEKMLTWFDPNNLYAQKEGYRFGAFVSKFDSLGKRNQGIPQWMQANKTN